MLEVEVNRWLVVGTILAFGFSAFLRKMAVDRMHPYNMQVLSAFIYMSLVPLWHHLASKEPEGGYNLPGAAFTLATLLLHIFGSVAFGLLLKSSNSTGALAVMISSSPVITTMLSIYFLGEKFELRHAIAAVLTLAGLTLFNMK